MASATKDLCSGMQRQKLYSFDDFNPYLATEEERPLVEENLGRLQAGEITLRSFLRQTPHFPRWQETHLRQARILLVTNEIELGDIDHLFGDLFYAEDIETVADLFQQATISWLSLTDHPRLQAIHGETPWVENGPWEMDYPRLSSYGKAAYFFGPNEMKSFAGSKVLNMELSPFAQERGLDINPRNDRALEYHMQNLRTVRRFCSLATPENPRYLLIIANRASISHGAGNGYRLEAVQTASKDKSNKIADLLRVVQFCNGSVQVRVCRHSPVNGRDAGVFDVIRPASFDLMPVQFEG